jgi:hypothetical protein
MLYQVGVAVHIPPVFLPPRYRGSKSGTSFGSMGMTSPFVGVDLVPECTLYPASSLVEIEVTILEARMRIALEDSRLVYSLSILSDQTTSLPSHFAARVQIQSNKDSPYFEGSN